jgi:hypothetical protein
MWFKRFARRTRLERSLFTPHMDERATQIAYYHLNHDLPMTLALARYCLWSTDGKWPLEVSEVRYLDCPEDVERLQDDVMAAVHTGIDVLIMTPEEPGVFPAIEAVLAD